MRTVLWLCVLLAVPLISQAATCSATAQCNSSSYTFTSADSTTAHTFFTSASPGNGAKITGVLCSNISGGTNVTFVASSVLSATSTFLFTGITTTLLSSNLLTSGFGNASPWTSALPVDENGNQFITIGPGSSFTLNARIAISSGNYACTVQFTQY